MASYRIEGNIISSEILDKIAKGEAGKQAPKDFGLEPSASLRDEIARAWANAKDQYRIFQRRRETLKETDTGASETRRLWMLPFFDFLGYQLANANAETVNGNSYAISHRAENLDGFPVHIMGCNQSLDEKPKQGLRISPHAILQEYLNLTEHLFGIVTNGSQLRLLRDASRLTRLSFLEFDLVQMMEEDLYSDFALLYRCLHASRMPATKDSGDTSFIEGYHQDALDAGSRIRERLSKTVELTIHEMANGFLQHPANQALRDWADQRPNAGEELYAWMLKIIYRMLFLMVTEERDLIYPKPENEATPDDKDKHRRRRSIYYDYYSIQRLRRLSERRQFAEERHADLWKAMRICFRLFSGNSYGMALGIAPLNGELFGSHALGLLEQAELDNRTLLTCLRRLNYFENERGQQVRVNYGSLDVEEFGSVYEGLLEYKAVVENNRFSFQKGTGRSSTGSHYTPDELVHPLIKHSLDHLIEDCLTGKRSPAPHQPLSTSSTLINQEKALLSLKVCDVACGSGHILLAAARRIGLALARVRTGEDQPNPAAMRLAVRDAIRHCIYGVDKNPLAVELCKVALWLEAHNPGQPLNFLDHKIKCGDAIVGLALRSELERGIPDEAFKTLQEDDKDITKALLKRNKDERKQREVQNLQLQTDFEKTLDNHAKEALKEYEQFLHLPETTPEEIAAKEKNYRRFIDGKGYTWQKIMAEAQVAQFFIEKNAATKDLLLTDGEYRQMLAGYRGWQTQKAAKATGVAAERRFFHWFLEFPEVFAGGGFDCVLGNPPFLWGNRISSKHGLNYRQILSCLYPSGLSNTDLCGFFFLRIVNLIKNDGFLALISTSSINETDNRVSVLDEIVGSGEIIAVKPKIKWPGEAQLVVSLICFMKAFNTRKKFIADKKVDFISTFLDDNSQDFVPLNLICNHGKSFKGVDTGGMGFVLKDDEKWMIDDEKLRNYIWPLLNADDILNSPLCEGGRNIINVSNLSISEVERLEYLYKAIYSRVYPYRQTVNREGNKKNWWVYNEHRPGLYNAISGFEKVIVNGVVSKYFVFEMIKSRTLFTNAINVFAFNSHKVFLLLSASIHEVWASKLSSSLGVGQTPRYNPTDCFETFPFPKNVPSSLESKLETLGSHYHEHRRQLMLAMQLGLTKTYNQFHNSNLTTGSWQSAAEVEKAAGKETAHLWKHLEKTPGTIPYNEAVERILQLRQLHAQMDEAVLEAYGWHEDSAKWGKAIALRHDFYEVDYLPENDRTRYTIHPDARKEVLKRLLLLNHEVYAEEVKQGLHEKGKKAKPKAAPEEESGNGDEPREYLPGEQGRLFEVGGRQGRLF